MQNGPANTVATIIPTFRYLDAPRAIDWLCRAFGFEVHLVVPGEGGLIEHAQLTFGNGMIMLGSMRDNDYDALVRHPRDVGGFETQSPYLIVADAEAHYATALAAGAEAVIELNEPGQGGKAYTLRDFEGRLWNFGTYDPWESE